MLKNITGAYEYFNKIITFALQSGPWAPYFIQ